MKLAIGLILFAVTVPAGAAVGLYVSSPQGPRVSVAAGQSFDADVTIVETFDQVPPVIGLDFTFAGAPMTLTGRDVTGSPLPDQISTLSEAAAGHDLGSLVDDLGAPLRPGSWHLGRYTGTVPIDAVPGDYALTFAAPTYVTATDFSDHVMNVVGSLPVTVTAAVPEPVAAVLPVLSLLLLRRRCTAR